MLLLVLYVIAVEVFLGYVNPIKTKEHYKMRNDINWVISRVDI